MPPRTARSSGTRADVLLLALAGAVSLLALVLPDEVRFPMAGGLRQSVAAPFVRARGWTPRCSPRAPDSPC